MRKIAILGYGTVGSGVAAVLENSRGCCGVGSAGLPRGSDSEKDRT